MSLATAAEEAVHEAHHKSLIETAKVLCEDCYLGIQACAACQVSGLSRGPYTTLFRCRVKSCGNYIHEACASDGICKAHTCSACCNDIREGEKNVASCLICDKHDHFDYKAETTLIKQTIAND